MEGIKMKAFHNSEIKCKFRGEIISILNEYHDDGCCHRNNRSHPCKMAIFHRITRLTIGTRSGLHVNYSDNFEDLKNVAFQDFDNGEIEALYGYEGSEKVYLVRKKDVDNLEEVKWGWLPEEVSEKYGEEVEVIEFETSDTPQFRRTDYPLVPNSKNLTG